MFSHSLSTFWFVPLELLASASYPARWLLPPLVHTTGSSVSSSCSQVTCPGSFRVLYFSKLHCSLESVAQLKKSHFLSLLVTQSINHSVTTCTTVNLLPVFQIKTHFSLPYVNTSHMHWLNVFHLKAHAVLAMLPMSECLPYAPDASLILLFPSSGKSFFIVISCPK